MSLQQTSSPNAGVHYVRSLDTHVELWRIDDVAAVKLGYSASVPFFATEGKTAWDVLQEQTPWFEGGNPFARLQIEPGTYYPRVARPSVFSVRDEESPWCPSVDVAVVAANRSQVEVLTRQLEGICRTVHPVAANMDVYGQDISNLLILACTEVEMNLRGVMVANGAAQARSTNHYVKLAEVLGLRDYAVTIPRFPWLEPIRPFANWDRTDPTGTLAWFAAYHGVKHNREVEFARATLRRAFEAVTACAILMAAQFGRDNGLGYETDLSRFFHFVKVPLWSIDERYCNDLGSQDWMPVNHPAVGKPLA